MGLPPLPPASPSLLTASWGQALGSRSETLWRGHAQPATSTPGSGGLGRGHRMVSTAASWFSPEWAGGMGAAPTLLGPEEQRGSVEGRGWNAVENPRESRLVTVGWRERRLSRETEGDAAACKWALRAPRGGGKGLSISGPRVTQARDFHLGLAHGCWALPLSSPIQGQDWLLAGAPFRKQNEGPERNSPPGKSPYTPLPVSAA